ncbi:MAG: hypothetical protein HOM18_14460 [Candidatus Marinimicrobia bacterium]|jgi:hypothetical protein|nr:hypothetical protein [Candidatus Neomarinimicrobiota bacterium]
MNLRVLKDAVPIGLLDTLKGIDVPWYYRPGVVHYNNDPTEGPGPGVFVHRVLEKGEHLSSELLSILHRIAVAAIHASGEEAEEILVIRMVLTTKTNPPLINDAHIDRPEEGTRTGILYLEDSDGPTILYRNKADLREISSKYRGDFHSYMQDYVNHTELEVFRAVEPTFNTLVLFNSNTIHSASYPSKFKTRKILNITYKGKTDL